MLRWKYGTSEPPEKDIKKAIRYYQLAAIQGHPRAQYTLGYIYEKGILRVPSLFPNVFQGMNMV